mgnify:CR=1 FL=1
MKLFILESLGLIFIIFLFTKGSITIDGRTARDFDDAVSARAVEKGGIEIGVHIADVSHFVRPGTALDEADGRPEERLIDMLVLRTLARALYSLEPRGHYALATDQYVHFTSPIRRYPDLVVHRMLRRLMEEGALPEGAERDAVEAELMRLGESCSAAERRAAAGRPARAPRRRCSVVPQEEAQRLGRILRPKSDGGQAYFYSVVSRSTRDQEFAVNRQLFLTEQGYRYEILYEHELDDYEPTLLELRAEETLSYLTAG